MPRDADHIRRWGTLALAILQPLAAAMAPVLGIGRPIAEMAAGSETPALPANYAFLIWTPIFALAIGYAVMQVLPAWREEPLLRRVGWWIAAAFAANVVWLVVAQLSRNGWHLATLMLFVLVPSLVAFLREARDGTPAGTLRRWLLQPLLGLLAGWATVLGVTDLSGVARAEGITLLGLGETSAAVLLIVVAGLLAAAMLWLARGAPWYAGAVAWAFAAIVLANMGERTWNLFAAAAAAAMLVLTGAVLRAAWRRQDRNLASAPAADTGREDPAKAP